jgi:flagellar basal-body rod protein FlgB
MLDRLFGVHSINLEQGLDRTSRRFTLVTNNLANVNVPNYKRRDLDFSVQLAKSEADIASRQAGESVDMGEIRMDGSSVDLEQETMAVAETELRYQLLTEMTNRYFTGLKNVIKEGR